MSLQALLVNVEETIMFIGIKEQIQESIGRVNKFETLRNPKNNEAEKWAKISGAETQKLKYNLKM